MMIKEIKIETGVPLPKDGYVIGLPAAMRKMEIGQSIVVEVSAAHAAAAASSCGIKITQRKINATERRVWRIG